MEIHKWHLGSTETHTYTLFSTQKNEDEADIMLMDLESMANFKNECEYKKTITKFTLMSEYSKAKAEQIYDLIINHGNYLQEKIKPEFR